MALKLLTTTRILLSQTWPNLSKPTTCQGGNVIFETKKRLDAPVFSLTPRQFSSTPSQRAITEFFDDPKNYGETQVKSGRPWSMADLRLKSNSDLHKLWFVLYKERNMLYTMKEASKQESEIFPSPERIDKVEESMANLENVVRERNNAYWQLEVSHCATGERPSVFRRDVFGRHRMHRCSQHLVPYAANWKFRNSQGPGNPEETDRFFRHYREQMRMRYNGKRSRTARYIRDIFRRFPNADVDYIAESHPEFPPGYVKHLKENHTLYDDPPVRNFERTVTQARAMIAEPHKEKLLK